MEPKKLPTLYLNENIPLRLVDLLLNAKINAVHTVKVGNQGIDDESQLQYATDKDFILVSHNRRHFRRLHREWLQKGKHHCGILVIGCAEPERLADRIRRFFEEVHPSITTPFCKSPPA